MDKPKFVVACWAQPPESFSKWVKDGVNVFIGPDGGNPPRFTQAAIHQKVKEAGAFYVDKPQTAADLERMVRDDACLAITAIKDEPELYCPPYNSDPVGFQKYSSELIASSRWISDQVAGRKPLFINFSGPKVTAGVDSGYHGQNQAPYMALLNNFNLAGVGKNIICSDWYPSNANRARYPDTFPGLSLKCLKSWFDSGNKFEHWAFLEISDQMLDKTSVVGDPKNIGRAPTPEEVENQLKGVLNEGASGIAWFSHQFQGQPWDPAAETSAWDGSSEQLRIKRREIAKRLSPVVEPPVPGEIESLKNQVLLLKMDLAVQKERLASLEKTAVVDSQPYFLKMGT